jgi:hypothetical protein
MYHDPVERALRKNTPLPPRFFIVLALVIVLVSGMMVHVVSELSSPEHAAYVQEQAQTQELVKAAREQWEKKNCMMLSGQYVCRSGSGTIAPWSAFQAARPDLFK